MNTKYSKVTRRVNTHPHRLRVARVVAFLTHERVAPEPAAHACLREPPPMKTLGSVCYIVRQRGSHSYAVCMCIIPS